MADSSRSISIPSFILLLLFCYQLSSLLLLLLYLWGDSTELMETDGDRTTTDPSEFETEPQEWHFGGRQGLWWPPALAGGLSHPLFVIPKSFHFTITFFFLFEIVKYVELKIKECIESENSSVFFSQKLQSKQVTQ